MVLFTVYGRICPLSRLLVPTAPGQGWQCRQGDTTGVSQGCGVPQGFPGVPSWLRGPRSTGAAPPVLGPCLQGSRWQVTPCWFGCSSASALCRRFLQKMKCQWVCVSVKAPNSSLQPPLFPHSSACWWLSFPLVQQMGDLRGDKGAAFTGFIPAALGEHPALGQFPLAQPGINASPCAETGSSLGQAGSAQHCLAQYGME